METKTMKNYEVPVVEVIEVEVEQGFVGSDVSNPGGSIIPGGEE